MYREYVKIFSLLINNLELSCQSFMMNKDLENDKMFLWGIIHTLVRCHSSIIIYYLPASLSIYCLNAHQNNSLLSMFWSYSNRGKDDRQLRWIITVNQASLLAAIRFFGWPQFLCPQYLRIRRCIIERLCKWQLN